METSIEKLFYHILNNEKSDFERCLYVFFKNKLTKQEYCIERVIKHVSSNN